MYISSTVLDLYIYLYPSISQPGNISSPASYLLNTIYKYLPDNIHHTPYALSFPNPLYLTPRNQFQLLISTTYFPSSTSTQTLKHLTQHSTRTLISNLIIIYISFIHSYFLFIYSFNRSISHLSINSHATYPSNHPSTSVLYRPKPSISFPVHI
jgi:hypothetical protein